MRVFEKEGASSHMFRNSMDTKRISLRYVSPSEFERPLTAVFRSDSTLDFDRAYDAEMMSRQAEDMFWAYEGRNPGVIDVRPFDVDGGIWIGITVVNEGVHTIKIDYLDNFEDDLYILDSNGVTHDLRENDFEVNLEAGYHTFKLVFKPTSTTGYQDVITNSMHVFYAPDSKNVVIDNFDNLTLKSAKIYNAIGQIVQEVSKTDLNQNKITVPFNVATGSYFVTIETTIGKASFKIAAY